MPCHHCPICNLCELEAGYEGTPAAWVCEHVEMHALALKKWVNDVAAEVNGRSK